MTCTFCDIVAGTMDATVLDETNDSVAFAPLDAVSEGHMLVVPREHYETLFDIPESALTAVTMHTKRIAERLHEHGYDGVNVLHASGRTAQQSAPHFHIHLAPRRTDDELDLWPDSGYDENEGGVYDELRELFGEN